MAKVKVAVFGTVGKSVTFDPNATVGATLGTNLFMADGTVATRASLTTYLGLSTAQATAIDHRTLAGLALGDDHPQYTRKDMLTTRGDLYYRNATTVVRLAKGSTSQFLQAGATDVAWQTISPVLTLATDLTGSVTLTNLANGTLNATIAGQAVTYAKIQDVSATSRILGRKTTGAGSVEECTLSQVLDFVGSAAQGDILYRGASGWVRLAAGTSGYVLTSGGSGANLSWTAGGGGGGGGAPSTASYLTENNEVADLPNSRQLLAGTNVSFDDTTPNQRTVNVSVAFSGASVYPSGAQSITTGTATLLTFDSELYDTDSYHSTSSNTSRMTVPSTGKYRITGWLSFSGLITAECYFIVLKNGTEIARVGYKPNLTGPGFSIAWEGSATAADYFELQTYQFTGASVNTIPGSTGFAIARLA